MVLANDYVRNGLSYCTAIEPVIKLTFDDNSIDSTGYYYKSV